MHVHMYALLMKKQKENSPVGHKRIHTLVAKSRACSSRCCGLSSVLYHVWEGKRAHLIWSLVLLCDPHHILFSVVVKVIKFSFQEM